MSRAGVVNEADVEWSVTERSPFVNRRKRLSMAAGGQALGCGLIELPPGAFGWPAHWHAGNEEAIYVLEGRGRLRRGDETVDVGPGDYIALPAGPAHAHQMQNCGEAPLRYLCFSTMNAPDVVVYPDSDKIGVYVGSAPGGPERAITAFYPATAAVPYYQGEPEG